MSDKDIKVQTVAKLDTAVRQRIKAVRNQAGISQAIVAEQLGIVPQQYHKYESGVLRLSGGMIAQIASVLDCSVLDLVPKEVQKHSGLDKTSRIDILKQELTLKILEQDSEDVLDALKTLLD